MTLIEQVNQLVEKIGKTGIGVRDALAIIGMTLEDRRYGFETVVPSQTFGNLNRLVDLTVHGAKIEQFSPKGKRQPFHTLEIHTEEGDILGHLNMISLRRRIPCYYLVYVEVLLPFRGMGLGNRILTAFIEFAKAKSSIGILDNIIPSDDPTYEIYTKLGWKKLEDLIGHNGEAQGNYMVFIPDSFQTDDLKNELIKILFNLSKKRSVIEMHDNEDMVRRTIQEFQSVYSALMQLFDTELQRDPSNPLMPFLFTRLTTKLIGFRRRIATLIGYTGGESLEQIVFSDRVKELLIQPYSMWNSPEDRNQVWGDRSLLYHLPDGLKNEPTFFIEGLQSYERPYLSRWIEKNGKDPSKSLKIADLLDLGFDPTRLKEFHHRGVNYIFERISPHLFLGLFLKMRFLKKIETVVQEWRFRGTAIRTNPILLIFCDKGNLYVLRKKVEGIHSQEALDQLRTSPHLKEMNRVVGIDLILVRTINDFRDWLKVRFKSVYRKETEELTYFFPWDIRRNIPKVQVDDKGISIEGLWIA